MGYFFVVDCSENDLVVGDTILFHEKIFLDDSGREVPEGKIPGKVLGKTPQISYLDPLIFQDCEYVGTRSIAAHITRVSLPYFSVLTP